jgi:peptide deformylase
VLLNKCSEVKYTEKFFEKNLRTFQVACMLNNGVAVAAPQLGIPLRFFYYSYNGESFMAINPEIKMLSDATESHLEGCLSIPGKQYSIERSTSLEWKYMDEKQIVHEETAEGWKARIIQHEIDHLDGICICDK